MREARLRVGVAPVLGAFLRGLGPAPARDDREADEHLDVVRPAPRRHRLGPERAHGLPGGAPVACGDEHALGVAPGEGPAAARCARLVENRRALNRWLGQVIALDIEEVAVMRDRPDMGRIAEHPGLPVPAHGRVVPASLPELVEHFEILVGVVVAPVMGRQAAAALAAMGAVEIAGDDVPADAAAGQVIEGREAPGEGIGRLGMDVDRHAEAEMLGHRRHGGNQQARIVDRELHRLPGGDGDAAAVDVVDAADVGDEQAVEQAALQQLRLVGPVPEGVVRGRPVARMGPQAVVDVADAVHGERVQPDLLLGGHQRAPCRGGSRPSRW